MAANHDNLSGRRRSRMQVFALSIGGTVVIVFGILLPLFRGLAYPIWPWLTLGVLSAWATVHPKSFGRIWDTLSPLLMPLFRATTRFFLTFLFFIGVSPIAMLLRALGKDAMNRRFDGTAESYRAISRKRPRENFENPY